MAPRRSKAKISPSLVAFGRRFRRYRDAKGWSQENVARRAHDGGGVTPQYIGQIETGRTRCTREFAEEMDRELEAGGELIELWEDFVKGATFPTWYEWLPVEETAAELTCYSLSLVHGLLQTPAYAEVLLYGDKEKTDERMARQGILTRQNPAPPGCTFLIDEGVFLREVGSPEIMREQLQHLVEASRTLKAAVHVVKMRGDHLGNISSFTIATMEDMAEVAYIESPARGFTLEEYDEITALRRALREVRALALPVDQSLDFIRKVQAERWI
ncbi:helix-turn-helix domain-containing protein [Actinomadura litoris]|uniref:Helix-turn-helix domain-containing protein n=1 Tax=Actinomadura litoris TaxID=2678616 RepID=A0A7K1LCY1_9ACTN|nr:helix-turn-helix transcriptional regulator [Actinomadura litoris]MUN42289.1 helix-turn-helix domain-containing protein [Actinomadura litoris]